jgi:cytoskeletal protein RodZ
MAIVSDVKCGRCDRRYSGLRARCPYCGARRSKRGKYAEAHDNTRVKLIIGVLLLAVLIVATMVLIFTSLPERDTQPTNSPSPTSPEPGGTAEPTLPGSDDVDVIEDPGDDTVVPSPEPTTPVEQTISKVTITYNGAPKEDITVKVGEKVPMSFKTTPETTGKTATWKSTDENVFMVLSNGTVTGIGKGKAYLICTVDGVEARCIVRVP